MLNILVVGILITAFEGDIPISERFQPDFF